MIIDNKLYGKSVVAYVEFPEGRFIAEIEGTLEGKTSQGDIKINNADYGIFSTYSEHLKRGGYLVVGRAGRNGGGAKSVSFSESRLVLLVERGIK